MDASFKTNVLNAFDSSEPQCSAYTAWIGGEFDRIVSYLNTDQAYEPFSRVIWCWHFSSYQQLGQSPHWKNVSLHWEVVLTFQKFRLDHVSFELHWENRQMDADKFRQALFNYCSSNSLDITSTGGIIGGGHVILTHQVPIVEGRFSENVVELIKRVHMFDGPIHNVLREIKMIA